jgi:hypothetical protein
LWIGLAFSVLALVTEFSGYLNNEIDIDIPIPSLPNPFDADDGLCLPTGLSTGKDNKPLISFDVNMTLSPEDRGVRQISGVILEVLSFISIFASICLAYVTGKRAADVEVKHGEIVPKSKGTCVVDLLAFVLLFFGVGFAVAAMFTVLLNKIKVQLHIDLDDIDLSVMPDELEIKTTTTVQISEIYGFTPKPGLFFEIFGFIFLFNGVFFAYLSGFRSAMNQAVRDGAADKAYNSPYIEMGHKMEQKDNLSAPFVPPGQAGRDDTASINQKPMSRGSQAIGF